MSLFVDGIQFPLGETIMGTQDGTLINTRLEGREAVISHEDIVNNAGVMIGSGKNALRSRVRIMRNETGGVLYAGELVVSSPAAGLDGIGKVSAKAGIGDMNAVVVDPTLPASGVADDDLFLAFVEGAAKVKAPAAGLTIPAAGTPLAAAASGRAGLALGTVGIPLTSLRVWDAMQTNLPGTASADDLALIVGTLGTSAPTVQAGDGKATTVTRYAGFLVAVPADYNAADYADFVINAGMTTTVSDGTAIVDLEVYRAAAPTVDICATAQQSINSLTAADKTFALTATDLVPGDTLICRVKVAVTDAATATAVIGTIRSIAMRAVGAAGVKGIGVLLEDAQSAAADSLLECVLAPR